MQPWTLATTSATCFCLASLKYTNTQILVYLYLYLYLCICLGSLPSTSPPPSLLNESLYSELYDHPANCVLSNFNEILFEKLWYSEQRTNQPTTNAYVIWRKRGKCCSQEVEQDLLWTTFQKSDSHGISTSSSDWFWSPKIVEYNSSQLWHPHPKGPWSETCRDSLRSR